MVLEAPGLIPPVSIEGSVLLNSNPPWYTPSESTLNVRLTCVPLLTVMAVWLALLSFVVMLILVVLLELVVEVETLVLELDVDDWPLLEVLGDLLGVIGVV